MNCKKGMITVFRKESYWEIFFFIEPISSFYMKTMLFNKFQTSISVELTTVDLDILNYNSCFLNGKKRNEL